MIIVQDTAIESSRDNSPICTSTRKTLKEEDNINHDVKSFVNINIQTWLFHGQTLKSKSGQASNSVFHPFFWCCTICCGSLGLPWCISKLDPEAMINVVQMNYWWFKVLFYPILVKVHWNVKTTKTKPF